MGNMYMLLCATVVCLLLADVNTQGNPKPKVPLTRFTCQGRGSGYYADVDTGCQVYHMCDGLGRQFSYKCPNMTLFQQRMLICDHWYMVNCSMSERDYTANLLIGQRDKPFVSDDEMRLRTPRPDILSAPPYNPYYDVLREAESQFPALPSNSIVGVADSISDGDNNDLDSGKRNYRPPTGWSTGRKNRVRPTASPNTNFASRDFDNLDEAASQEPDATFRPTPSINLTQINPRPSVTPPSIDLVPPPAPTKASEKPNDNQSEDSVFKFIKRFDPTSPDVHQTAMSRSEIIDLNGHLPAGPANSEEDRTPRKHKNFGNSLNTFETDNDKSFTEGSRFDSVNTKSSVTTEETIVKDQNGNIIPAPDRVLLPPKEDTAAIPSTTVGPPIYYEWKWAVPAFDLVPPKEGNKTNGTNIQQTRSIQGKSPFSSVTRPEPKTTTPLPSNTEYNISSYFIPDYVFPLDKAHPGYESDDAETSFQVKIRPGRQSFGENPKCPQCHPAYLKEGTCEPCIVKR
ncbi:hypothetical protein B5X24_HaOG204839 [Helicoverpa armigera]|uniref:Chitin-binding type-2 domain-containing protein n=1 Tax=Helicoverpa armigera TaxID=29058 RepID=A0A2W1BWW0_HELAM|nr:hypothetical protein B5X24_HaOG204839 [Helicoverpa armigera]